jgi:AraC-like DNA-binding protein
MRTCDREVAAEAINRIIAHQACIGFDDPDQVDIAFRLVNYGDVTALQLRLAGVRYAASVNALPAHFAGVLTAGRATVRMHDEERVLGPQDGMLFPHGMPYASEYDNTTTKFLILPQDVTAEVAETTTGVPAADLRFEFGAPVSEAKRRFWARTVDFLSEQLTAPGVDHPPLVVEQFLRHAASAVLTVFPNTTMTAVHISGPGRARRSVVDRATAFMEAHAGRPLTVARIAAAAGVDSRTLQEAFRRHLDTTPRAYLRRIRLDRVRRELLAADPAGGTSADQLARRWGFTDPAAFLRQYRSAYGVSPDRTWHG